MYRVTTIAVLVRILQSSRKKVVIMCKRRIDRRVVCYLRVEYGKREGCMYTVSKYGRPEFISMPYIRTYIHVSELSCEHPKVFQTLHV
jgi:hypothetical protein